MRLAKEHGVITHEICLPPEREVHTRLALGTRRKRMPKGVSTKGLPVHICTERMDQGYCGKVSGNAIVD